MLQIQTVEPDCLALLEEIMTLKELKTFRLAGDTAPSLRLGHRKSVDLDLFTTELFEANELITSLKLNFNDRVIVKSTNKFGVFASVDNIKVDFIFRYEKFINDEDHFDNLRLASLEDIIAMKILAASSRSNKKDYYDLFELLETFKFEDMISIFSKIYKNHELGSLLKSLTDFHEIDIEEYPITFKEVTWDMVKKRINENISSYIYMLQQKRINAGKDRQRSIEEIIAKKKNK